MSGRTAGNFSFLLSVFLYYLLFFFKRHVLLVQHEAKENSCCSQWPHCDLPSASAACWVATFLLQDACTLVLQPRDVFCPRFLEAQGVDTHPYLRVQVHLNLSTNGLLSVREGC